MGSKNIKNLDMCTVTDIIDYFEDLIGNDLEDIIYSLYDPTLKNVDKENIDKFVRNLNVTNIDEIYNIRRNMIYNLLQKSIQNEDNNIKLKIINQIYIRYHQKLMKPENIKKMRTLKDIILGDRDKLVLSYHDKGKLIYDIITRDDPKSVDSITDSEVKELIEISLDSIAFLSDLNQMTKYPGLASNIVRKCLMEFMYDLDAKNTDVEEIMQGPVFKDKNKILDNEELRTIIDDEELLNLFKRYVIEYLKNNLQLIDTDTLLTNSVARLILGIRINSGEKIDEIALKDNFEEEEIQNAMRNSIRCLHKFYKELQKRPNCKNLAYQICGKNGRETVDLEYIEQFLQRCTQYKYFTNEDIEVIHRQIKQGILPEDMRVRKIANINIDDLVNASKSYESTEEDEEKKAKLLSCSLELIKYLRETGAISNDEKLLEMYLNGDLNIDILDSVEMPEILEENHIEKFKTIYEETEQDDEEETHKKKLIRYSELYKKLINEGKIDTDNLVINLIEEFGNDGGKKILIDLFNLGIIDHKCCYDYAGIDILVDLFNLGKVNLEESKVAGTDIFNYLYKMKRINIQPNELNRLFYSGDITFEQLVSFIKSIPSIEEKMFTIDNIFPDESEAEYNKNLRYQSIEINDENVRGNSKDHTHKDKKPKEETVDKFYNKNITYASQRLKLLKEIDEEYSFTMAGSCYAIIKCPNIKMVIIEKIHDKNEEDGYGTATYFIEEDFYLTNEDKIVVKEKSDVRIKISALKEAKKEGKAFSFSHTVEDEKTDETRNVTPWGKKIIRFVTTLLESEERESEYIEEKITKMDALNKIINKNCKKSRYK